MSLIMWMLAFWLLASVAVAFFALCLIRGGATRDDEEHLALEAKKNDESNRAAVA